MDHFRSIPQFILLRNPRGARPVVMCSASSEKKAMETALRALTDRGKDRDGEEPTPPGFEVIDRVQNPVDKAQLLLLMYLIYRIGPLAVSMAVMAGAPMKSAYAIHNFMIMALALEAEEICAAWGIGRLAFAEERNIFKSDNFDEANWEGLAELAGEPVDMQAWQAWARERSRSSTDASEQFL